MRTMFVKTNLSVRTRLRRASLLLCSSVALASCVSRRAALSHADIAAIQRAALFTLFVEREHSGMLVLINVARDSAPVLQDSIANPTRAELRLPDTTALAFPIAVRVVTLRDVQAVFRDQPDGWKAWYARYPVSAGIVELTAPLLVPQSTDAETASVTVARSCGEHCRAVWHVLVRHERDGTWRTISATAVALPKD